MIQATRPIVTASLIALVACARAAVPAADNPADLTAIRNVSIAWFAAYAAGKADSMAALYTEDAILGPPGVAPVHGRAAIRDYFVKDIVASAGYVTHRAQGGSDGSSGDLAWDWNTYTVTDKSGATVDSGKYITVYAKRDGRWEISRDIWNSDTPPPSQ